MQFVNLLLEDIAAVRNRYPNISDVDFTTILNLDPTYRNGSNSVGKYTKWLLNLFNKGNLELRLHVKDLLQQFEAKRNSLQNKDIGQFKSIEELEDTLAKTAMPELSNRQKLRQTQKAVHNTDLNKDAELVFDNDGWEVWIPNTYEASCRLGRGSSWCTASTSNDYYYNMYTKDEPLYILINKSNNDEKYQFHFESTQFMDKDDYTINILKFLLEYPNLFEFFKDKLYQSMDLRFDNEGELIITIPYSDLADNMENRDMQRDFIEACFNHDISEYWESFFDYGLEGASWSGFDADEQTKELLQKLNLTDADMEDIIDNKYEDSLIKEELRGALVQAVAAAQDAGGQNECLYDFEKALDKAIPEGFKYEFDSEWNYLHLTANEESVVKLLLKETEQDNSLYEVGFKTALTEIIAYDFKFYEPYSGWWGFDSEVFNDVFQMGIHDLLKLLKKDN